MCSSDYLVTGRGDRATSSAPPPAPKPDYYLHPGGVLVSPQPCTITTILGSCVSVCLFDSQRRIGGMNHFLLSRPLGPEARPGRFGESAVALLIQQLEGLGCRPLDLKGKVFGGARINGAGGEGRNNLGAENVGVAFELLRRAGIPVVAQDTCGDFGRKVLFHTDDGTAWVRRIGGGTNDDRR